MVFIPKADGRILATAQKVSRQDSGFLRVHCPSLKHHFHAGRSVYRQASVSESDHRTCGRPGRPWEDIPAETVLNTVGFRPSKEAPSLKVVESVMNEESSSCADA
jgi:hypothetical protein